MTPSYYEQGEAMQARLERLIADPDARTHALAADIHILLRDNDNVWTDEVQIRERALVIIDEKALSAPICKDLEYHEFLSRVARNPISRSSTAPPKTIRIKNKHAEYHQTLIRMARDTPSQAITLPAACTPMTPSMNLQATALVDKLHSLFYSRYAQGIALAFSILALIRDTANANNDDIYIQELASVIVYKEMMINYRAIEAEYLKHRTIYVEIFAENVAAYDRSDAEAESYRHQRQVVEFLGDKVQQMTAYEDQFEALNAITGQDLRLERDDLARQLHDASVELAIKENALDATEPKSEEDKEAWSISFQQARLDALASLAKYKVIFADCQQLNKLNKDMGEKLEAWMNGRAMDPY